MHRSKGLTLAILTVTAEISRIRSSVRNVLVVNLPRQRKSLAPTWPRWACGSTPVRCFRAEYRNQIFIAEHGSWNRSTPIGYRITVVQLENNKAISYKPFAEGWLQAGRAWGRPVDLLVTPDGALLVSDDEAGVIYRIRYKK